VSSDTQFTALGPTDVGFLTHGANIQTGASISGRVNAVVARAGVAGVEAVGDVVGVSGACGGARGHGVSGTGVGQLNAGLFGQSITTDGNGLIAQAPNGANAYAIWAKGAAGLAGQFDGRVRVRGNFEVSGTKAALVALADGSHRRLYSLESPDSWFEDFGSGQLVDGVSRIDFDEDFAAVVELESTYHVFLSEYGANNGLFVMERTSTGFEVRSSTPAASAEFSYRIVAKRADAIYSRFEKIEPSYKETSEGDNLSE
jgi:hypothetical protein